MPLQKFYFRPSLIVKIVALDVGSFVERKKNSISLFVLWFRGPKLGVVEHFGNSGYVFKGYQLDRITETHHTIYHSKEQTFAVQMVPSISSFDFLLNEDGRRKKKKRVKNLHFRCHVRKAVIPATVKIETCGLHRSIVH